MTGSFQQLNGKTKVIFEYQADTADIQDIADDAAHLLWNQGYGDHGTAQDPIEFTDLTNQEKLDLLDFFIRKSILRLANDYKVNIAMVTAKETEEADPYVFD